MQKSMQSERHFMTVCLKSPNGSRYIIETHPADADLASQLFSYASKGEFIGSYGLEDATNNLNSHLAMRDFLAIGKVEIGLARTLFRNSGKADNLPSKDLNLCICPAEGLFSGKSVESYLPTMFENSGDYLAFLYNSASSKDMVFLKKMNPNDSPVANPPDNYYFSPSMLRRLLKIPPIRAYMRNNSS